MGEENHLGIIIKIFVGLGKHFRWVDSDLCEPPSSKTIQIIA